MPERADYPDDESFENAMMRYLQDTDQVLRPRLEPLTQEQLSGNRTQPPPPQPQSLQPQSTEPQLVAGEQVFWRRDIEKGFWRKRITEIQLITNLAIRINHVTIGFSYVDKVVVTNRHSTSKSKYSGYSAGGYSRGGVRVHIGEGESRSRHYGDLVFFLNNGRTFTLKNVEDASGIKRLIDASRKGM